MKQTNEKQTFFILICVLLILLILTGLAYRFRQEINVPKRLQDAKTLLFSSDEIYVKFNIIAGINDQNLRIKFSVPCGSLTQKYDMMKKIPMIKNDMLMAMSRPDVITSVEERDFKKIKKHSLQVINNYSDKKIKKLYVEFFALD
jgi:hypothetical protein